MSRVSSQHVVFRLDVSMAIGLGHLVRSAALASALKEAGWHVHFVVGGPRSLFGDSLQGFDVVAVDGCLVGATVDQVKDAELVASIVDRIGAKWVVVDHYGLGVEWEVTVRGGRARVLAIDDLGRTHDCDLLLDQNFYVHPMRRYEGKVPKECSLLLGPRYALLRKSFFDAGKRAMARDGKVKRVLVSFGATDPSGEVLKVLAAMESLNLGSIEVTVIKGAAAMSSTEAAMLRRMPSVRHLGWVENMAEVMLTADIALGAGGTSTWERCAVGLPASVILAADNQRESMEDLAQFGAVRLVGEASCVDAARWRSELEFLLSHPDLVRATSERALRAVHMGALAGPQAVVSRIEEVT